jgi:hypothetical protein
MGTLVTAVDGNDPLKWSTEEIDGSPNRSKKKKKKKKSLLVGRHDRKRGRSPGSHRPAGN